MSKLLRTFLPVLGLIIPLSPGLAQPPLTTAPDAGPPLAAKPLLSGDGAGDTVLPVDEALALSALIEAPDTVVLLWDIRDGYYMYRKSIAVTDMAGGKIAIDGLPEGELVHDEFFGDVRVYHGKLLIRIPLTALPAAGDRDKAVQFMLAYQGCAEDRYCYPPQRKMITLALPD